MRFRALFTVALIAPLVVRCSHCNDDSGASGIGCFDGNDSVTEAARELEIHLCAGSDARAG